ncbi:MULTISPECIES: hypothetical protein [Leptospirillum]|jgi:hypothetical protein|uniref:DUF4136 domain-containing protein n=2 Tax=Leptospirillum ferriphilum TaxID=178606 RepID=A0A1V3SVX8_9BACT|nr:MULTISPECIES: hypothetical protein [Leptospirillum]EAY57548.1 MAG: protein of unknown function [Leptospirillum rubarum]EIJ75861.1 MAG: hypothetical protein C75L2_00780061 [Leptospirillum sp. Group II 'C75']MCL5259707.1 hypothetical protein [Nitrospirota bacterium]AFS52772.1 hypothetical protein LFML04_0535 [Leptospirillum ferriphilum ML-04]AKS22952.1 hypothetical protein ABH19_03090 [Leptospirillum sp. Group II 'CF-1']
MRYAGRKWFLGMVSLGLALTLSACAHNRVTLGFTPMSGQGVQPAPSSEVVVTTLADHRFRLYSFTSNDMPDTVGWGQGTGTLYTPENIPAHVSRALVEQYRNLGLRARYDPSVKCQVESMKDGHVRVSVTGASSSSPVLCGSIVDYQFQIDHPMVGFGTYISTYDMAAGATLMAEVSLHLFLVDPRDNHILWTGVVNKAGGAKDIHPPHLNAQGVSLLEQTLAKTIIKSAKEFSPSIE